MVVECADECVPVSDIAEKRFINSPLWVVPLQGYRQDVYSQKSICYMKWFEYVYEKKGLPIRIQHALQGGKKVIPSPSKHPYKADGFFIDPITQEQTIISFHECFYHACPKCLGSSDTNLKHPLTGELMSECYKRTLAH